MDLARSADGRVADGHFDLQTSKVAIMRMQPAHRGSAESSTIGVPLSEPYLVVDRHLRVVQWSAQAARTFDVAATAALGACCWDVVPAGQPSTACRAVCPVRDIGSRGPRATRAMARCRALPIDGKNLTIVWPMGPATGGDVEELMVVGAVADALAATDLHAGLERALDLLRRAVGADDYELFLTDPENGSSSLTLWDGVDADVLPERTSFGPGAGYPGIVSRERRPLVTKDVRHDRRYLRRSVVARGIRSYVCVPLSSGSQTLGSVHFAWRRADAWIDRAVRIISRAATPVCLGVQTVRAAKERGVGRRSAAGARVCTTRHPELRIRCFGPFAVELDGRRVPVEAFHRRKAVTLLKMLVLKGGKAVSQSALAERLWPEADERNAANCLHGLVHAVRSVIEPAAERREWRYLKSRGDLYLFDVEAAAFVDVARFRALVARARAEQSRGGVARAAAGFDEAVSLVRGDLFEDDPLADWCAAERLTLRNQYVDALRDLAGIRAGAGDHERAVEALRAALRADPLREDLHRGLVMALLKLARRAEALEQYRVCLRTLRDELGARPLPETLRLEDEIAASLGRRAFDLPG